MLILPPKLHIRLPSCSRQGEPPISTIGLVGIQVPAQAGIQGMGVRTPIAAAVAAATCGFAIEMHIPKLVTFAIGIESFMVAAGFPPIMTLICEVTFSMDGALPKVHIMDAPAHTNKPILISILPPLLEAQM